VPTALLIQETPGRVGDGHQVVAHLEDDDALDVNRDSLTGHAVDRQVRLVQVEREPAHHLHPGEHERPPAGDDPEAHPLVDAVLAVLGAGDQQRLVGLGHPPHRLEHGDQDQDPARRDNRNHQCQRHFRSLPPAT
jgi:hypothetical protein